MKRIDLLFTPRFSEVLPTSVSLVAVSTVIIYFTNPLGKGKIGAA